MQPKILVVDDDSDGANLLARLFRSDGYEAEVAYSGLEAIEKAASWHPQVVFLDIRLPDIDGHDVAEILRRTAETEEVVLIALTGWGNELDRKRAEKHGFDVYLTKPVDIGLVNRLLSSAFSES